jgi:GTP-binding protein
MKIASAFFVKSCVNEKDFPDDVLPEVAFVGRSNVGKSSLINILASSKNLVKTSSTPGKTQVINFFKINNAFYFVDLPGYGYARVPEDIRRRWGPMIEGYLSKREKIRGAIFILDIRHLPTEDDKRMKKWLDHYRIPVIYVATKIDKISYGEVEGQIKKIIETLGLRQDEIVHPFSARNNIGRNVLLKRIDALLKPNLSNPFIS